jgi:uncharacterized SAM-binding protein YcdF (DUF218 family)
MNRRLPALAAMIGGDGFVALALSQLVSLATAGLGLLWLSVKVVRTARLAVPAASPADQVLVLGFRLCEGAVDPEYEARLERAAQLLADRPRRRLLILGGVTGTTSESEAAAGRRYLLGRGVPPERIAVEERSRHTLENLNHARSVLGGDRSAPFLLVTSRYHLERSLVMARGLGLKPLPCPAEERLEVSPGFVLRVLREAFFLHWYYVGRTWSRLSGNRGSLRRIS